jgi:hypothetical protein
MDIEKFRSLMFNVSDEIIDRLESFDQSSVTMDGKVSKLQDKLANYFKDRCYEHFEWLEAHGNVIENDKDFAIKINNREVNKKKAEKTFLKFHECCAKNDFGIRDYFAKVQERHEKIRIEHPTCLKKCQQVKDDGGAATCIKDCFLKTIGKMNESFEDVDKHIEDYNTKF